MYSGSSSRMVNRDLYKEEGSRCADIARSPVFENTMLLVISANAVWIAVEVDNNPEEQLIKAPAVYQVVEHSFCFIFTCEWLVRFMAYRRTQDCPKDMWFVFDTLLLLLMVAETWVLTFVMLLSSGISGNNLNTLTVLRLLRLLRLTRITRLMRALPEMMFIIQGLLSAVRSVAITLLLVMIMVYCFAIAFVQLTRDAEVGDKHFESVWPAMVTLTIEAILPDQGPLLEELSEAGWYYGVIFFIFLVLATLTMVNMLIGILCEVACRVSAREKEIMDIEMVEARLLQVVRESLDCNHDGSISKSEFLDILKSDKACKALHQVGVEAADLVSHADFIYDEEDEDGSYIEKKLEFRDFMKIILKMRGTNVATIRDISNLQKFVKDDISRLERIMNGGVGTRRNSSASGGFNSLSMLQALRGGKTVPLALAEDPDSAAAGDPTGAPAATAATGEAVEALSADVKHLNFRMGRLEELLTQVLEGQQRMGAMSRGRAGHNGQMEAPGGDNTPLADGDLQQSTPSMLRDGMLAGALGAIRTSIDRGIADKDSRQF